MKAPILLALFATALLFTAPGSEASIITDGHLGYAVDFVSDGVPLAAAEAIPLIAHDIDGYKTAWKWIGAARQTELESIILNGTTSCEGMAACRIGAYLINIQKDPTLAQNAWQRYVWYVQVRAVKAQDGCTVALDLFGNGFPPKPFRTHSVVAGCSRRELLAGIRSAAKFHFDVPKPPADFSKFDGLHFGNPAAETQVLIWVNSDEPSLSFLTNELPALVQKHGKSVYLDIRFINEDIVALGTYCAAFYGKGLESLKANVNSDLPREDWIRKMIKVTGVDGAGFEYCVKEKAFSQFMTDHYQPFYKGVSIREAIQRKIPYVVINEIPVERLTDSILANPPVQRAANLKRKIIHIE